jgi:pectate lyase
MTLSDRESFRAHTILGGVFLCLAGTLALASPAQPALLANRPVLAFPDAEGFGALATGGRGGDFFHVTSLEDSGPGTLRDAVSRPHRMIVFDVGGVIRLKSNVAFSSSLTLLGQTAPGDGMAIYGRSVSLSGATNVIVHYLRIRQGISGDRGKCSINLVNGSNMIFDHVSIQWGRWDCLGLTQGSHDITFQNCIFGQGIDPQCFGALVDSVTNITFSHNLWIDNKSRNPKAKGTIQYINNIVYNWGVNGLVGGHSETDHQLDVIGNYFISGPSSNNRFVDMFTATDHVFQKDNYVQLDHHERLDGQLVTEASFRDSGGAPTFVSAPLLHPPVAVTVDPPAETWQKIVESAGCSLHRDAVDRQLITELCSLGSRGQIIRNEAETGGMSELRGGQPPPSSVHDGIADVWKIAHALDPNDPDVASGDYNHNGYSNLEKYANELTKTIGGE